MTVYESPYITIPIGIVFTATKGKFLLSLPEGRGYVAFDKVKYVGNGVFLGLGSKQNVDAAEVEFRGTE